MGAIWEIALRQRVNRLRLSKRRMRRLRGKQRAKDAAYDELVLRGLAYSREAVAVLKGLDNVATRSTMLIGGNAIEALLLEALDQPYES